MIQFVRCFKTLLDRAGKKRLVLAALGAVATAAIEGAGLVLLVPLVQVITQAETGVIPASADWVANRQSDPTSMSVAAVLAVVVLGAFILKGITSLLYLRWNIGFVLESEAAMSRRLLAAYLRAPYPFHLRRNSAELQRTVQDDVRRVYQDALVALIGGTADLVLIAAVAVVLVVVEPVVAVCAAVYFAVVALGYQRLIHGRARAAGQEIQERVGESFRLVQQSLGAVKDIKIRHREEVFVEELYRVKRSAAQRFRTLILLQQTPRYYLEIALIAGVALMAAVLYPLRSPASATAVLSLFVVAGFRLLPSLNRVLVALSALRGGQAALERVAGDLQELEASARVPEDGGSEGLTPADAGIRFESVSFAYEPDAAPVLRDVSFTIRPRESVAFVGPSGAGKSTLLDIVLGLLEPDAGEVAVGGYPLSEVRTAWQRSIGYVPQDVVLLDETLRTNVALGTPPDEIDDAQVERALALADLAVTWRALPEGLDTRLGERGTRLSGGQRQRVGLARALYHDPAVLVLDEATSSLDGGTESRIMETIEAMQRDLTVIVVTHRLSTVRNCDRIYLVENGAIAADGSFEKLAVDSASFAELVRHSVISAGQAGG
jgi:ABC-type multidrug transport system fused ATPase/permease subunit